MAILAFISLNVLSQKEVKLDDIGKHVGDSVRVCDKVYGGIFLERRNGTPTFLNVGGSYSNHLLTIVIWPEVRKEFTEKPEEFYKDKKVCVVGKVELFRDKPQIVLHSKGQIIINE